MLIMNININKYFFHINNVTVYTQYTLTHIYI